MSNAWTKCLLVTIHSINSWNHGMVGTKCVLIVNYCCLQVIKASHSCPWDHIKLSYIWNDHQYSWLPHWSCPTFVTGLCYIKLYDQISISTVKIGSVLIKRNEWNNECMNIIYIFWTFFISCEWTSCMLHSFFYLQNQRSSISLDLQMTQTQHFNFRSCSLGKHWRWYT